MRPYSDFASETQVSNTIRATSAASIAIAFLLTLLASALTSQTAILMVVMFFSFAICNLIGAVFFVAPADKRARQSYEGYLATLDAKILCSAAFDPATPKIARDRIHHYLERTWPQWGKSN